MDMNDLRYAFCEIFVHGPRADDLHAVVSILAGPPVEARRSAAHWWHDGLRVEAEPNPHAGSAGYRGWRWVVRVRAEEAQPERIVGLVGGVLESLWRRDIYAVASCAFAEELPRGGGLGWML